MKITIHHVHHHYHHDVVSPELLALAREIQRLAAHNDDLIPDRAGGSGGNSRSSYRGDSRMSASQSEVLAALAQAKQSLQKTATEIPELQAKHDQLVAKVQELQTIVDQGGVISPELQAAAAELVTLAQAVDDLIPDAPAVPDPVPGEDQPA